MRATRCRETHGQRRTLECELAMVALSEDRVFLLAWAEFLNHPEARKRMRDIYASARSKLRLIIDRGREEGSLRPGPAAELVAGALVGGVEGLLLQWLVDPEFELRAHFEAMWEVLMGGLCT